METLNAPRFLEELNFFIEHQDDLVRQYRGKILVLKGHEVVGVYRDLPEAYFEAQREHELGTFMLQPCEPGPDAYTTTIVSSLSSVIWPHVTPG